MSESRGTTGLGFKRREVVRVLIFNKYWLICELTCFQIWHRLTGQVILTAYEVQNILCKETIRKRAR